MKNRIRMIAAAAAFLAGIAVLLAPGLMKKSYEIKTTKHFSEFREYGRTLTENVPTSGEDRRNPSGNDLYLNRSEPVILNYPELYRAAQEANLELFEKKQSELKNSEAMIPPGIDLEAFGIKNGIMAYVEIPAVEILLPVYLGASDENLKKGAAHVTNTSLPLGGNNTNCVICAHTNWDTKNFFNRLKDLETGDEVFITNLWTRLKYTVCKMETAEDSYTDCLKIQEDRDLLTLFTCNYLPDHKERLIVTCERDESR